VHDLVRGSVNLLLRIRVRAHVGDGVLDRKARRVLVLNNDVMIPQVVDVHDLRQAFDALLLGADGQGFDVRRLDADIGVYRRFLGEV
jgi:hypothetical protein